MPRKPQQPNQRPRFRVRTRRGAAGQVYTYYFWDGRTQGRGEVPLGSDFTAALERYEELEGLRSARKDKIAEAFDRFEREVLTPEHYPSATTRRDYLLCLTKLRPVFGNAVWASVKTPHLAAYRDKRSAKTRANRELAVLSIVWGWAREWGLTQLPYPGFRMRKNKERARLVQVSDEAFEAIYAEADPVLRQALDTITATGLRITDVLQLTLPQFNGGQLLRVTPSKTQRKGKTIELALNDPEHPTILADLYAARMAHRGALHMRWLAGRGNETITYRMLADRFGDAREKAAKKAAESGQDAFSAHVRGLILRDMRKHAADKAESLRHAQELLQHDDVRVTRLHYRGKGERVKPSR